MKSTSVLSIQTVIDMTRVIRSLSDRERVMWLTALLETIEEEGTITTMREVVGEDRWDDQP